MSCLYSVVVGNQFVGCTSSEGSCIFMISILIVLLCLSATKVDLLIWLGGNSVDHFLIKSNKQCPQQDYGRWDIPVDINSIRIFFIQA